MLQKSLTMAKNSLKRKNLSVMVGKVAVRLQEHKQHKRTENARNWYKQQAEPYTTFLEELDIDLWKETNDTCQSLKTQAEDKLKNLNIDLGGGGNYHLLYFLTRHTQAQTVVETGVAAGWSSQAILTALQNNKDNGHLYSSDFPYFRQENPEKLIGYVVDEELKDSWTLLIDGDQNNLPKINAQIDQVDILHYDSDKSYKGRQFALKGLQEKCHDKTLIIFDDIQDNAHFMDHVSKNNLPFKIFEFEGKYVGLIAPSLLGT